MNFPPPTEKQARIIWVAVTGLALAVILGLIGMLGWGVGQMIRQLSPVLWPLAVAGILAYLLDPVVDAFERRRVPRARAILLVFAMALMILLGIVGSVVPQLVRETRELAEKIPAYTTKMQERVERWVNNPSGFSGNLLRKFFTPDSISSGATNAPTSTSSSPAAAPSSKDATASAEKPAGGLRNFLRKFFGSSPPPSEATNAVTSVATNQVSIPPVQVEPREQLAFDWSRLLAGEQVKTATEALAKTLVRFARWLLGQFGAVASFFGVVAGLALVPVYAFYLLLEKRGIERSWTDYLPVTKSGFKDELVFVLRAINDYLIVFFRGQVLVAMCDGVLYAIGFLIIGIPYALLLGALAVPLTMIPFLGAIVTCVMALIISVVQFGDWLHPLLVLAVFGVVQALEGLVIQPKIIGDRVGLHPLTIIIAVITGTTLFGGLLGGILAIPLTAALRVLMFRYVWKRSSPAVAPA